MSMDQIRRLKLLKDLEKSPRAQTKSATKYRTLTSISMTDNLRKLNKNKKYLLEEERNTQIERNNRLLYEKIMGHFQNLKETVQHRNKWRKRKKKLKQVPQYPQNQLQRSSSVHNSSALKFRSRVKTIGESHLLQSQTLFLGMADIDGLHLKIKLTLSKQAYCLMAKNGDVAIELEMDYDEYMRIHNGLLQGNPCNIFKYLTIENDKIKFQYKRRKLEKLEMPNSVKINKTTTIL